jgi:predicted DNA-binding protein (UPF0278 family)
MNTKNIKEAVNSLKIKQPKSGTTVTSLGNNEKQFKNMSKKEVEEYVKDLIKKYRKRIKMGIIYD